jgi:hypothetical protein
MVTTATEFPALFYSILMPYRIRLCFYKQLQYYYMQFLSLGDVLVTTSKELSHLFHNIPMPYHNHLYYCELIQYYRTHYLMMDDLMVKTLTEFLFLFKIFQCFIVFRFVIVR